VSTEGDYNAYYFVDNEKLVLNVKNVDIFLNPAQGMVYDVWDVSRNYDYPIPESGLTVGYPVPGGVDWTYVDPKPKQKTFFEFAQTFWKNMINVRNRQFMTDGKTSGYPTLSSIYWKYLESEQAINVRNDNFNYQTMIDFVNGMGDYWIRLVEQMVPATTIWNTGVRLENSIFHRQKFVWRRQEGCKFVPVPCKPCVLTTQLYVLDCPTQEVLCPIYPWDSDPNITNFGVVLNTLLDDYFIEQGYVPANCQINTVQSTWYVDVRINNVVIAQYQFYSGVGPNQYPTDAQWITALEDTFQSLQTSGYGYNIDTETSQILVFNTNCQPNFDELQINVGINFNVFCKG
jgi:hypothetical protein